MSRLTKRRPRGYLERTLDVLHGAIDRTLAAELTVSRRGLLQRLDPRVKVVGLLSLIAAVALARNAPTMAAMLGLATILAALSRLTPALLLSTVWIGTFVFTAALAGPAIFLTPGRVTLRLPLLGWPVTAQGLTTALYLILRVEAAATFGFLLVFTTPWAHVLKALRALRVPVVVVVVLGMTYRYVLLLLESASEMFEARRSRTVGSLAGTDRRRLAAASVGVLLSKALHLSGEVFLAMQARGFRGEVYLLDEFRMTALDWTALGSLVVTAAVAIWVGR
ncbi:MAG TPA: cobalt ECF transporter T component CbiQ [Vicinamibacterales bacterium]|jgi:cobalt ECF transporter T component CbiQ